MSLTAFHFNKPLFLCICSTSLLKTLLEKEKLLVMSTFSFFHSVFCPFGELCSFYIKFIIFLQTLSVWRNQTLLFGRGLTNAFDLGKSWILLLVRGIPLPNHPEFLWPWKNSQWKTVWEKQKMLVTSIFCFPQYFPSVKHKVCHSAVFTLLSANVSDFGSS